ncbi:MAG TPA: hypothetical protein VD973_11875 [Symbiobacteriaceae bacterium]|nr:hypothetical protein [Symbiobacteriaceae bacterium]
MIPKPAWLTEEPDKWPDDAREFYRLCHAILKRAEGRRAEGDNPGGAADEEKARTGQT